MSGPYPLAATPGGPMRCSACRTDDHPREAHHDPALARVEAERASAAGEPKLAAMWRWVAANAERRVCS